jgi:hypothetical protein
MCPACFLFSFYAFVTLDRVFLVFHLKQLKWSPFTWRVPMKSRLLVACASSFMMLLALPSQTRADSITTTFDEDTASFSLIVESTLGINGNDTHSLIGGADWALNFTIQEFEKTTIGPTVLGDLIVISGTATHKIAPHGEPPNPQSYGIPALGETADGNENGMHTVFFPPAHLEHPNLGHFDDFESRLEFVVAGRDITRWTFVVKGKHTEGVALLAEPSTLTLLGVGVLALVSYAGRRRSW